MHKMREFETFSPKWGCLYQIPPLLRAQELPTPTPRRGVRKSERVKGPGGCYAEFDVPGRPALFLRQTEKWMGGVRVQWRWGKLRPGDLMHERKIKKNKKAKNDGKHKENKDPLNQADVNSQAACSRFSGYRDFWVCEPVWL